MRCIHVRIAWPVGLSALALLAVATPAWAQSPARGAVQARARVLAPAIPAAGAAGLEAPGPGATRAPVWREERWIIAPAAGRVGLDLRRVVTAAPVGV